VNILYYEGVVEVTLPTFYIVCIVYMEKYCVFSRFGRSCYLQ